MTRVSCASVASACALALSGMLVAACGDDGSPPAFADGAVNDARVNDASVNTVDAMAAVDGPMNTEGPVITVLDPTDPAGSLDSDDIVVGSRFTVRCRAEQNVAPVDSTTVTVTATSGGVSRESSAAPTTVPGEYQGDIVVSDFPNGDLNVRCTAADTDGRTNSANVDTFLDQGPAVQVLSPLANTSYATQVAVSFTVTAAPVASSDPGGAVDFGGVQVLLGGQDITSLLTHDGSGGFAGDVQFADPIFDPTLDGPQTLIIKAPNTRNTVATVRERPTVFTADALGPSIVVSSPAPGDLVSGIVTFKATITDDAGVNPTSVIGTVAGVNDFTLVNTGGDEYEGSFDTRQLGIGMIFPNVVIRAQDMVGNQSSSGFVVALDNQAPLSSLDPPRMRERQESELNANFECGELFDPLGPEAVNDGEVVPQLFRLSVRAEDRGNSALANPGTLVPFADIDENKISIFVLDDSTQALIVDTNGDGVCDAINPLLTPTSVPTASNEAAVINMGILTEKGGSIYRAPPPAMNQPDFYRPDFFPSYPEQFGCAPPEAAFDDPIITSPVCGLQSAATRIIELETSSKSALWGIPPINDAQCFGNAFDALATNITDGWACVAVQVEDNLGNLGVSPPLRVCVDHDGDTKDGSGADLHTVHGCGQQRNIEPTFMGDVTVGSGATSITAGASHTCALTGSSVRCWGEAGSGQLGYGNTDDIGDDETPDSAGVVMSNINQLDAGDEHTCAVTGANAVMCWGNGGSGRLGLNSTATIGDNELASSVTPVNVGTTVTSVSAGGAHTCVVTSGLNVRCWGEGDNGRLGHNGTADIGDDELPSSEGDVAVGFGVQQVVAGGAHTCALSTAGLVRCWGSNSFGQLGLGNTDDVGDNEDPASVAPVNVSNTAEQVAMLAAGDSHTCALMMGGAVRCWGNGADGRLGYGSELNVGDDEEPWIFGEVHISNNPITAIAAGANHTCALDSAGSVFCWGQGFDDQLGYNRPMRVGHQGSPAAARFVNLKNVSQLAPGGRHTCVRVGTGVNCWGANDSGQLGHADKGDDLSNIGDIAPVWMRPSCTGTYDPMTNTTDNNTPCRIPESFQDNPGWQLRRSDLG